MKWVFFFQAEDGIRDLVRSRGLGDVYKKQMYQDIPEWNELPAVVWRDTTRIFRGLDKREIVSFKAIGKDQRKPDKSYTVWFAARRVGALLRRLRLLRRAPTRRDKVAFYPKFRIFLAKVLLNKANYFFWTL